MKVIAVKTHKITDKDRDLFNVLDKYITHLEERSVVAVTSKIVAITEGSVVKVEDADLPAGRQVKDELIKKSSQYYIPREKNKYNIMVTITDNTFIASAGIDESNANGNYILWPKNAQESANKIRKYLVNKFGKKNIGVIITDSKTTPLRWGVTAIAIAFSGFEPLVSYIGKKDLFGREFVFETMSVIDSLATAASFTMGEGAEQTPLAVITDIPHIEFTGKNPTKEELDSLKLTLDEDLYGQLLKNAPWEKGKK